MQRLRMPRAPSAQTGSPERAQVPSCVANARMSRSAPQAWSAALPWGPALFTGGGDGKVRLSARPAAAPLRWCGIDQLWGWGWGLRVEACGEGWGVGSIVRFDLSGVDSASLGST